MILYVLIVKNMTSFSISQRQLCWKKIFNSEAYDTFF